MNKSVLNTLDLSGQIALVTGASSGLGAHFATVLAQFGATVVAAARRTERLEALVNNITQAGGKAIAVAMDVNDSESVKAAFNTAQAQVGSVSILINNAGVAEPSRFVDSTEDNWDFTVDTNLKAVWRVSREASERMIRSQVAGSIINIASILGLQPSANNALYATAKAGVVQLTKNSAQELWRHNIRVNALCPGYFETEINADFFKSDKGAQYLNKIPPRRLGQMDELTMPLLMLASSAGSFVTGVALPVDGGHLLQSL
ncbi:2-dehydro-3-deoxy-D-gluconate 5-dehydrogenase [Zhongshania aliphaticivorans]|uniref:2-dehydro-3-deoxy-D-gluconate 5-dehydrogenase n=1 Tax=Zhongshania aliphaticivorans TaxID=1470434 RepID=A0A5S9NK31_9GAMM|nr:SDR family NAD(P)-dependent oxidoreductase [Zhongshania aliphaticivorans]CAA0090211.1 2-dehydro-3-deoxy-D-gluconate 5-dehydrogenase [Zhongshania aliphaticivorans]CAA0097597.1 2-dehydro-3-deoxy-D-gluconate 5-dehydrogenase [Zhongshania aliphaticivorans]